MEIKQTQRCVKGKYLNRCSRQGFARRERKTSIQSTSLIVIVLGLLSFSILLSGCPTPSPPQALTLGLSLIAEGFNSPVGMAIPDDDSGRIFIVDQVGIIRVIDANGNLTETPFLDITDRLVALQSSYDERGLLSMTFHPDFVNNGRFFVFYNAPLGAEDPQDFNSLVCVSEFLVSPDDPNKADSGSEIILLEVVKPQSNHNGGQLAFGQDGFLYISIGDGGAANDVGLGHTSELGNGQDTSTLLGKLLRYDADTPGELNVPTSNPFTANSTILGPIYAYGLRNPWRFSFDMGGEKRLFCADAGQDLYEEVDIIVAGGNYGWNIKEGSRCFDPDNPTDPPSQCPETGADGKPLIDPIIEYSHINEASETVYISVIGGYVYRGNEIPALVGRYIFGDFSSNFIVPDGAIFVAEENEDEEWKFTEAGINDQTNGRLNRFVLGFGQDTDGEIYLLAKTTLGPTGETGQVFKIVSSNMPAVDIYVENFRFDADDDDTTQIDTAIINVGDTVRWVWREGVHTITSGESSSAPDAGALFDVPSNGGDQIFSFTFTEAGTVPYFCRPHEVLNMKGIIVVQ
jgi:glucose/arabinose dehydrogenase/plastocyanin